MTTPTNQPVDFLFELVIAKRGWFLMEGVSYREWLSSDRDLEKKLLAKGTIISRRTDGRVILKNMNCKWN